MAEALARKYDIIIFGATGFTGGLTADYLAGHPEIRAETQELTWALAGRNRRKLEGVRNRLAGINPKCADIDLIEIDVNYPAKLKKVVEQARVVITTVGPYIHYGEPLVKACAEASTDYVDLTGEPEFVDLITDKYEAQARKNGARIVNCCGFDSIPHDLGVLYTVEQVRKNADLKDKPLRIEGFVRAGGTFSGGTWHSAIHAMSRMRAHSRKRKARGRLPDLTNRKVGSMPMKIHKRDEIGAWAVPFPTIDPEVVKRSARALKKYGPDFKYGHFMAIKRTTTLLVGGAAISGIMAGAQFSPTRKLLLAIRDPGEGPNEEQRAKGWFKVRFVARVGNQTMQTQVSGGDPGYGDTAKMLGESALCLLKDRLPKTGGILTPAVALGKPLIKRLEKNAGMTFEVLQS